MKNTDDRYEYNKSMNMEGISETFEDRNNIFYKVDDPVKVLEKQKKYDYQFIEIDKLTIKKQIFNNVYGKFLDKFKDEQFKKEFIGNLSFISLLNNKNSEELTTLILNYIKIDLKRNLKRIKQLVKQMKSSSNSKQSKDDLVRFNIMNISLRMNEDILSGRYRF